MLILFRPQSVSVLAVKVYGPPYDNLVLRVCDCFRYTRPDTRGKGTGRDLFGNYIYLAPHVAG